MGATTIVALPMCPVAGAGTNIWPAFTTRKHAREKGREYFVHHLDQRKRSCLRVVDPWMQHVSVNKNAQTIGS